MDREWQKKRECTVRRVMWSISRALTTQINQTLTPCFRKKKKDFKSFNDQWTKYYITCKPKFCCVCWPQTVILFYISVNRLTYFVPLTYKVPFWMRFRMWHKLIRYNKTLLDFRGKKKVSECCVFVCLSVCEKRIRGMGCILNTYTTLMYILFNF